MTTNINAFTAPRSTLLARVCAVFVLLALPTTSLLGRVYAETTSDAASTAAVVQHSNVRVGFPSAPRRGIGAYANRHG